jgi:hypothetical protein
VETTDKVKMLIADAEAAYAEGLCKPVYKTFRHGCYACLLTAALIKRGQEPKDSENVMDKAADVYELPLGEIFRIVDGFDNPDTGQWRDRESFHLAAEAHRRLKPLHESWLDESKQ